MAEPMHIGRPTGVDREQTRRRITAAVAIYGIVMPIVAGMKANGGERYRYPLTFRIIS